jgi:hypothetical protein
MAEQYATMKLFIRRASCLSQIRQIILAHFKHGRVLGCRRCVLRCRFPPNQNRSYGIDTFRCPSPNANGSALMLPAHRASLELPSVIDIDIVLLIFSGFFRTVTELT